MPLADIRRILTGLDEAERQQLLIDHRARLEARLDEVRSLLDAVDRLTREGNNMTNAPTEPTSWLHYMPHLPVSDIERSAVYYQGALGFRLAWQTTDGKLTALASGTIELLLLTPWEGDGPPPAQSAYVHVEDPDALCAEYEQAGVTIVDRVATRPYGMRDFIINDLDGHRFVLGRGDDTALRNGSDYYGLDRDEITADPSWLRD